MLIQTSKITNFRLLLVEKRSSQVTAPLGRQRYEISFKMLANSILATKSKIHMHRIYLFFHPQDAINL